MWKVDVGLEEMTGSVGGISGVMAKWCHRSGEACTLEETPIR
jgi:hypothetical protein